MFRTTMFRTRRGAGQTALLIGTVVVVLATITGLPVSPGYAEQNGASAGTTVYLPVVTRASCPAEMPRINAPKFTGTIPFERTAIAWFGKVSPTQNYTDIRVGYNANELYVYLAIFDRHLWYDDNPAPQTLTQWDAASLLLDTSGGAALSPSSWKFVAQLYGDRSSQRRAAYRGSATGWQQTSVTFDALPGWRGNALNDNSDSDRGWAMGFTIPFSSL
ncbi:MAG: hypothetical protein NZ701_00360, partial [Roseiflexus sp.]|nr:hypothetical protein [Roseiflexus sp.]